MQPYDYSKISGEARTYSEAEQVIFHSLDELVNASPAIHFPFVIPTYNNASYLHMMVKQLRDKLRDQLYTVIIVDNWSTHGAMQSALDVYGQQEDFIVVKKFTNDGPRDFYHHERFKNWLPQHFIVTDPDIGLNPDMPDNFVSTMIDLSEANRWFRVGLALDIEMPGVEHNMHDILFHTTGLTMYQWEARFWTEQVGEVEGNPIYSAPIDTTFCLINKAYDIGDFYNPSVRIAGCWTAQHYGWYNNPPVPDEEHEYYLSMIPGHWSETGNAIKRKRNQ